MNPIALHCSVYLLDSMREARTLSEGHKFRRGREWTQ